MYSPIPISLGDREYAVYVNSLSRLPALMAHHGLRKGRYILVTDHNVGQLYANRLEVELEQHGWMALTITLPAGESTKSPVHLQTIYDKALSWGIDRKTPILALGGGVIGDLAGLAAATLLRGIPLVQLPTTLIAQVDSALGGKTGINHSTGKNLIGAFHQPVLVCTDLVTLQSLPEREWTSGMAEVIKHALIADSNFLEMLETNWTAIMGRKESTIGAMIHRAAHIKADVVSQDEKEAGLRAILNFGHTFGHAIERVAGYGQYTHGEAVAIGMRMALRASKQLHPSLDIERADHIVSKIPLPNITAPLTSDTLIEAMTTDKKTLAGRLRFVLLDRIGHAYVESETPAEVVRNAIEEILFELADTL